MPRSCQVGSRRQCPRSFRGYSRRHRSPQNRNVRSRISSARFAGRLRRRTRRGPHRPCPCPIVSRHMRSAAPKQRLPNRPALTSTNGPMQDRGRRPARSSDAMAGDGWRDVDDRDGSPAMRDYDARRCYICGRPHPPFGFGPPLRKPDQVLWACGAHREEVERLVRGTETTRTAIPPRLL